MLTAFHVTYDLNLAAALSACGVPVVPSSVLDEVTGKRTTKFALGGSGHLPAPALPHDDPDHIRERHHLGGKSEALNISAGLLKLAIEDGSLATTDPAHPVLDVLTVLHARECLRTYMERGTRYRIQLCAGAARSKLVPGDEPLNIRHMQSLLETWHTEDLALAAAMARIGVPVLGIRGAPGTRRAFVLPRWGHILPGRPAAEDATALARLYASGELARSCPEHPLVWGMAGIKHRLAILRHIENGGSGSQVVLRHAKSLAWAKHRRSAMVEERAPASVLDNALRHLRG